MGKAIKIVSDIIFFIGLAISGAFLVAYFTGHKPFGLYVVSSGSMEPAIKTGSVIAVAPQPVYRVGEVITYKTTPEAKSTTTHRVVGTGGGFFKVAGDANDEVDPGLVPNSAVL